MDAPASRERVALQHPEPPEEASAETAEALSPHVLWLTPDKPDDISVGRSRIAERLDADGIEVDVQGTTASTVRAALRDRDEYDVIVGTTRSGAMAGTLLSAVTGTPLIVDHVDPIRQMKERQSAWLASVVRWFENLAFWHSDRTLFVYEEERSRVDRYASAAWPTELGVDYDRIAEPAPEVVEAARERLATHDGSERERTELDSGERGDGDAHAASAVDAENAKIAIYVGGLEPIYHIEPMLESVDRLEDWRLVVLGTGTLEEGVERAADDRDDIVFPGSVPHEEVPGFLALADVGVCLVDDPWTLKVLEYGAARLPTVHLDGRTQSRFGDRLEYCEGDPEDIARAVERASERDGGRLQEYVSGLTWDAIGVQYRRAIADAATDHA